MPSCCFNSRIPEINCQRTGSITCFLTKNKFCSECVKTYLYKEFCVNPQKCVYCNNHASYPISTIILMGIKTTIRVCPNHLPLDSNHKIIDKRDKCKEPGCQNKRIPYTNFCQEHIENNNNVRGKKRKNESPDINVHENTGSKIKVEPGTITSDVVIKIEK